MSRPTIEEGGGITHTLFNFYCPDCCVMGPTYRVKDNAIGDLEAHECPPRQWRWDETKQRADQA